MCPMPSWSKSILISSCLSSAGQDNPLSPSFPRLDPMKWACDCGLVRVPLSVSASLEFSGVRYPWVPRQIHESQSKNQASDEHFHFDLYTVCLRGSLPVICWINLSMTVFRHDFLHVSCKLCIRTNTHASKSSFWWTFSYWSVHNLHPRESTAHLLNKLVNDRFIGMISHVHRTNVWL